MSSLSFKYIRCYNCDKYVPITEEKFPEDLFDLINFHCLFQSQLFWICSACKTTFGKRNVNYNLAEGQEKINQKLDNLTTEFQALAVKLQGFNLSPYSSQSLGNDLTDKLNNISVDDSVSSDTGNQGRLSRMSALSSPPLSLQPVNNSAALSYAQSILNSVRITKDEEKSSKKIVNDVLSRIIENLKLDPEFRCLYNKLYYTGSSYNDLRITSASEYDINLVLHMPSNTVDLKPEFFESTFAFGKIKVNQLSSSSSKPSIIEKFLSYCQVKGYLVPQKVLSWLQRHIDKFLLNGIRYPDHVSSIKSHQNGPARTLMIYTTNRYPISIDLVPVFEFDFSALEETPFKKPLLQISEDTSKHTWFMVPKVCQGEYDLYMSDAQCSWRVDFPNAEKIVLHDKPCAKPIIKILKLLRDKQKWKNLASYYLKTVVLLEVMENPSKEHWGGAALFDRLLYTLKQLEISLDDHHLPHFLTKNNLLFKFNEQNCLNWKNFLNRMISSIESDPKSILKFFPDNT